MINFGLLKNLAVLNLLIGGLIVVDTFLIQSTEKEEVFISYKSLLTSNVEGLSHWANIILTQSGKEYREPANEKYSLKYQDTFSVQSTRLFNRPIKLIFKQTKPPIVINTGALNESKLGQFSIVYILTISIMTFFDSLFRIDKKLEERLIFFATALLLVVLFFYFK